MVPSAVGSRQRVPALVGTGVGAGGNVEAQDGRWRSVAVDLEA